jgi:hypothetical protein
MSPARWNYQRRMLRGFVRFGSPSMTVYGSLSTRDSILRDLQIDRTDTTSYGLESRFFPYNTITAG